MSEENVENRRRAFEAWNRRDIDGWLKERLPISSGFRPALLPSSATSTGGGEEIRQAFAEI